MRNHINIALIAIISLVIISCKNSGEKNTSDNEDSIKEETFTSPDLSLFQLKGPVKKCVISMEDMGDIVYEFDKDGNLISPKYEKIERDTNGAIIEYYNPESECTTRIKWEDGKVIATTDLFGDGYNSSSNGYEYDKDNNLVQMTQERIAFPFNYSDYKFDEFGNWISRIQEANGTTCEEKRYITYYGSDIGQERLLEYYNQKREKEIQQNIERAQLEEGRAQLEEEQIQQENDNTSNQNSSSNEAQILYQLQQLGERGRMIMPKIEALYHRQQQAQRQGILSNPQAQFDLNDAINELIDIKNEQIRLAEQLGDQQLVQEYKEQRSKIYRAKDQMLYGI